MIQQHTGDLLAVQKGIIVHGCNARGVMGSGIARQIKEKWPGAYATYRKEFEINGLRVGDVLFHKVHDHLLIANAITQADYGRDPKTVYVNYEGVYHCFEKILVVARWLELPIHFPLIGCGLANGTWGTVSAMIDSAVPDPIEKHLWIYPEAAACTSPQPSDPQIAA